MTRDPKSAQATVNGERYAEARDEVFLGPQGLPVAFRLRSVDQCGAWGFMGVELVTPRLVKRYSMTTYAKLTGYCTPLN
jgi:hypothetical protein